MKNKDIREQLNKTGVRMWEVADKLGIYSSRLSEMMRYELPEEKKNEIMKIIELIVYDRKGGMGNA